jgi:hypothetical protein
MPANGDVVAGPNVPLVGVPLRVGGSFDGIERPVM